MADWLIPLPHRFVGMSLHYSSILIIGPWSFFLILLLILFLVMVWKYFWGIGNNTKQTKIKLLERELPRLTLESSFPCLFHVFSIIDNPRFFSTEMKSKWPKKNSFTPSGKGLITDDHKFSYNLFHWVIINNNFKLLYFILFCEHFKAYFRY